MAGDAKFALVQLLLHGDGTDGSTTIVDSSSAARTVTAVGNAQIDTAQSVYGGASININSSVATVGNYLSVAHATSLNLAGSDFCIDVIARWPAVNATNFSPVFMAKRGASTNIEFIFAYINNELVFYYSTNGTSVNTLSVSWTPVVDTVYKIRANLSGNDFRFFVNGAQVGTTKTLSDSIYSGTAALTIFGDAVNAIKFSGWLEEVRLTIGDARETTTYTPQSEAWPDSVGDTGQLTGNVTEGSYSYISKWLVKAWKSFSNTTIVEQVVTGATYAIDLPTRDPYCLACAPYIDGKWAANKVVTLGQFYTTSNPETSAHLWEVTTAGTFDATEATWNLSGTTTQGTATMTYVGALPNPSILGPKIPMIPS